MIKIAALAVTLGIFAFAGWKGLVVALFMIGLFEFLHYRVYGKSIAEI